VAANLLTTVAYAADTPLPPCIVDVRLVGIVCDRATDDPDASGSDYPRGEYYLRIDAGAELGPFELGSGESTTFNPGLLLLSLDTGISVSEDAFEREVPIVLHLSAREDDSSPAGEDGTDDRSEVLRIRENVTCPASTTSVVRVLRIPDFEHKERRRKTESIKVALKLITRQ